MYLSCPEGLTFNKATSTALNVEVFAGSTVYSTHWRQILIWHILRAPLCFVLDFVDTLLYGVVVENGLPSWWHKSCTTWRPEERQGGTPPPGITHWPAM